jgi:Domain of unknown function (DUF4190)
VSAPYQSVPVQYGGVPPQQRTNTLAIVGFVLAFFFHIGAVVCGHIALAQIRHTGEQGRGLAIAALVLGYLGLAITILVLVVWVVLFAGVIATGAAGAASGSF